MNQTLYRFGPFELEIDTRSLRREGEPVPVAAKTFDCIRHLIEHRHRAVGRDELIRALWGHPDISDGVLGQTILLARRALDDTGREQQYIRTVQRYGYHWRAPVLDGPESSSAIAAAPGVAEVAVGAGRPRDTGYWLRRAAPFVAIAVLAALAMLAFRADKVPTEPVVESLPTEEDALALVGPAIDRLLVRPLTVHGDDDMAWFRIGGMALVGDRLRDHGLSVVPGATVVALAGHVGADRTTQSWLEPTGAQQLVDGTARRDGARWHVELIAASADGQRVGHVRHEGEDLLATTRRASDRLALRLGGQVAVADTVPDLGLEALIREIEAALLLGQTAHAADLLARADAGQRQQPALRLAAAHLAWLIGDHDQAGAIWNGLVAELDATRDRPLLAGALNGLGVLHFTRGEHADAIPVLDQAISHMDPAHPSLGQALNNRALAHSGLGNDAAARADFAEARTVLAGAGDNLTLVNVDLGSAMHALVHDRLPEALLLLDRVADDYTAFGHRLNELNARMHAARTRWLLLDAVGALETGQRMAELEALLADSGWRAYSSLTRSQLLIDAGRIQAAQAVLNGILADDASQRDATLHWQALALRAQLAWLNGAASEAERDADRALTSATGRLQRRTIARIHLLRVRAALASGRQESAHLQAFQDWADNDGSAVAQSYLAIALGEHAHQRGDITLARSHFDEAMQRADAGRVPRDLLAAASAYASFLLTTGQQPQAQLVTERVAGWANQHYEAALMQLRLYHDTRRIEAWRVLLPRVRSLAGEREIPAGLLQEPD